MATKDLPSPDMLRQLLTYDPATGNLTWKARPVEMFKDGQHSSHHSAACWNAKNSGMPALAATTTRGYHVGAIFGRLVKSHRVIWAMVYGEWPAVDIDHINGDTSDNRIANLRSVSQQENRRNQAMPCTNTSGVIGVGFDHRRGKWFARIKISRKTKHLGYFVSFSDACASRKAAEIEYGFHANHGRVTHGS